MSATMRVLCPDHGVVDGRLVRGEHRVGDLVVSDALAYECPKCDRICALPPQSAGRVFLAQSQQKEWKVTEFRVPKELQDLALNVHAHFGSSPSGDLFSLPLHLGLRLAGDLHEPASAWHVVDDFRRDERARPRLSEDTLARMDGLAATWGNVSRSDVFRWLIVAASRAALVGFAAFVEQSRPLASFDVDVADFLLIETPPARNAVVEMRRPDVEDFALPPMPMVMQ